MRQLFFAFALCVIACLTPSASADPLEINYAEHVIACVSAAGGDEGALNACQGAASQPCMDAPSGESTIGMVMRLGAEGEAWGSLMAAAQSRLATARPDTTEALLSAQRGLRRASRVRRLLG